MQGKSFRTISEFISRLHGNGHLICKIKNQLTAQMTIIHRSQLIKDEGEWPEPEEDKDGKKRLVIYEVIDD